MNEIKEIYDCGVIPVAIIERAEDAVPTAEAILSGDVCTMEITFRTYAAQKAIENVSKSCPKMIVGAGTVLSLEQCRQATDAGARFIVSPGLNEKITAWCLDRNIDVFPGCVTPTEIMRAIDMGLNVVKFFPANVYGGLAGMKVLSAPFGSVKFIPTGGIGGENLAEYLRAGFVYAAGGSWLCGKKDIAEGNFDKIARLCGEARKTVMEVRS